MPVPTLYDIHVDKPLSRISVSHLLSDDMYVASTIFPIVPVMHKSDSYYVKNRGDELRDTVRTRAPGAQSHITGVRVSTQTYNCEVYSEADFIADQIRDNTDPALAVNLDFTTTRQLTQKMMTKVERDWASQFFATSIWTDKILTTKWDAGTATTPSTPIEDIEDGVGAVLNATGMIPNMMVMGWNAWRTLKHHPDIVDRYKHTTAESITTDMVARLFTPALTKGIRVGTAVYNTAAEGATESLSPCIGDGVLIAYVADAPGLMTQSAGYTFAWTNYLASGTVSTVSTWRDPSRRSDMIEVEAAWDHGVIDSKLGYWIADVAD